MQRRPDEKSIPVSSLTPDPEGAGLLDAPEMQIYDRILMETMQGLDGSAALEDLAALPVEARYVFRIVSALGLAFSDFDSACVRIDLGTLPASEVDHLKNLIEGRTVQFCILLREFFGAERMKNMISAAAEGAL